ncbi:MAG: hypothetical protein ACRD6X_03520 [Pyrinomonadaceae bacterium]
MSAKVLNSLLASIREAGGILRGEITDFESWSISTRGRARPNVVNTLAVFVGNDDDFVTGKIYDVRVLPDGGIIAISETGESVILESSEFLIAKFQPKAEKLLRQLVSA